MIALVEAVGFNGPVQIWRELVNRLHLTAATGVGYAVRRFSDDLRHARTGGSRLTVAREIWSQAAEAIGAELIDLGEGFFEIRKGRTSTKVYEQTPPLNDQVAVRLANDKALAHRLLRRSGVSVPDQLEFSPAEVSRAIAFLEQESGPCIVKPNSGISGLGVTSQIRQPRDVRRAAHWAARFDRRLLIERQVEGDVYRILVLDGEVLDAIRQLPPRVTGDGRSTISALVAAEYEHRLQQSGADYGMPPLVIDLDGVLTLRRDGLTPRTVVERGRTVRVKTVTNQNRAQDKETALTTIGTEVRDAATSAAAAIGLRLAGVDVVTSDPSRPLAVTGGAVIDVNDSPGLWHHYRVRDRSAAADIAVVILQTLLPN